MNPVVISDSPSVETLSNYEQKQFHRDENALSLKSRVSKKMVLRLFENIKRGELILIEGNQRTKYGALDAELQSANLEILDEHFYERVFRSGSLGAAESFIEGHWRTDDLTSLIRIFAANIDVLNQMDATLSRITNFLSTLAHRFRRNSKSQASKNIHEHYNLGNDFFALFLDQSMMYSSAFFETEQMSLEDASVKKLEHICKKLELKETDHILEIGTGWGGFAEFAARNYGCRITTTTISYEQFVYSKQRIKQAGLEDRVEILLSDYRDLTGLYDKIVSIEMIEAVGYEYFDTFFRVCGQLLKPDGRMVLQGITMPEQRYRQYLKSVDFIQKYIFPGGCLPSLMTMGESIAKQTDMRLVHVEDFATHYSQTLRCWRNNFFSQIEKIRSLGFSDQFIRMWEYYFCSCEAAFSERLTGVVQMVMEKPACRSDITRMV